MTTDDYFKTLAHELRKRKLSEDAIADALRQLHSHMSDDPRNPESTMGSPRDYAATFPTGDTLSRGTVMGRIAAAMLVVMLGVKLFLSGVIGVEMGLTGSLVYFAGTVIVTLALIMVSVALDRSIPNSLRRDVGK